MTEPAAKPKKIDQIHVSTSFFLESLSNTETIFFEISRDDGSMWDYGIRKEDAAQLAIAIDEYNASNPPASIQYVVKHFQYTGQKEPQPGNVEDKMEAMFLPQRLEVMCVENGNKILTTEEFKKLLAVFEPYFYESYGKGELIQYLYEETKKKYEKNK